MTTDLTSSAPPPQTLRRYVDLPGPMRLPVVGNLLQIKPPRFHLQLEDWARQYGPIYRLQLGPKPAVVFGDHQLVQSMLRDRPDGFRRSSRLQQISMEMGLPSGVFNATGETWKRQRRMVMHGFDPTHVRRYFPSLQGVAQRLVGRWRKAAAAEQLIDLQADLMRYTVDTIAGLAFGAEVNTLESDHDRIQQHLDKIFPAISRRVLAPLPIWRWWTSAADRELAASLVEVKAAIDGFISQARVRLEADPERRNQPQNLLEAMIAAADQPASGIDDAQVAGNVLTMLLAGEDTTANTIAWMIHLLWQNPKALATATDEVRRVCGEGGASAAVPTLAMIEQLNYVEACAHETMRLKPVAPMMPQEALRDTTVGDVQIEKGMIVFGLMRRDAISDDHVPRATEFDPDRWLGLGAVSQAASSAKRISMPFGAGPRICPGRYLALLEMKMAMAVLLQHFDVDTVQTPDGRPPVELLSFTMTPVGLGMRLRERG